MNPEVTLEEEPETEAVPEIGSRCGSCHWLDGDGNWHVGDVPEDEWQPEADEAAGNEADNEEWIDEQQDAADDGEDQLEHWAPDADEQWGTADEAAQEEEQCEDNDAGSMQDENYENDDGPDGQWEASENDDGPDGQWGAAENDDWPKDEQREAAENANQDEQWEAAENDDVPEQDEQWEASAEAHEGLWSADDQDPSAKERQLHEAADGEGPEEKYDADEEWQAPVGDHAVATADNTTDWVNWPKAPATNVTQDYPSKAEVERLDAWWSRYKVKEP